MVQIIGLCGLSCSGKSSIAKTIDLPKSIIVSQSNYIKDPKGFARLPNGYRDTENPKNIKFDELISEVKDCIASGKYENIIVDGHLIFASEELVKLMNQKFFIDITEKELFSRKAGKISLVSNNDFVKKVILPSYAQHIDAFKETADSVLNGSKSIENLITEIKSKLN